MRWLVTGDEFGAAEAHRIGLVQEVAPDAAAAAVAALRPEVTRLFGTADAAEGVRSFIERRPAAFRGC